MFITALLTIARTWKQPRCPLTDEWIQKLWYIYTMECYSALKKNTFESVLMRWMNLEPIKQSEISQKDKDKYHILVQWHPTPVLLPGKSHGWRSLVGCSPRGHWESDMTKWLSTFTFHFHALEKEIDEELNFLKRAYPLHPITRHIIYVFAELKKKYTESES